MVLTAGAQIDDMLDSRIEQLRGNHQAHGQNQRQPANRIHAQKYAEKDDQGGDGEMNAKIALLSQALRNAGKCVVEGFNHAGCATGLVLPARRDGKRLARLDLFGDSRGD